MAPTQFGQPIFVGLNADHYSNFNDRPDVRWLTAMGPLPPISRWRSGLPRNSAVGQQQPCTMISPNPAALGTTAFLILLA